MHQSMDDTKEDAFGSSPEPVYCHPNIPDDRSETPTWETSEVPGSAQPDAPSAFDGAWGTTTQATDFNPFEGLEGIPRRSFRERTQNSFSDTSCPRRGRSSSPQGEGRFDGGQPVGDSCVVHVEQKYVGYIVGTSGRTIIRLSDEMNVKMKFDQSTSDQGYSTLHIAGIPAAVGRAKARIENIMERYDENSRFRDRADPSVRGRSRSPSVTSSNLRSASRCSESSFPGSDCESSVVVRLEQTRVGLVIGRRGQTAQKLEREYSVKIHTKTPPEGLSKIFISGDADCVKQAKACILEIIASDGHGDVSSMWRGRLRECVSESSDSSRAASPSWSDSDCGSRSGTGTGWQGNKSQWQSKSQWHDWRRAPWAPTRFLRSKMEHLKGRWYCDQHCYEVQLDAKGYLMCSAWCAHDTRSQNVGSWQMPRAIYYEGHDIFLGERCRFFLNSITTSTAVWGDEQRPGVNMRWLRSRRFTAPSGGQPVSYKSKTYSYTSGSKETFRLATSDFPLLG